MLALASRSALAIASPTSSGTCEPPGASRKTKPPSRSEPNRARTVSTSNRVAAMERAYPRVILGCGNFGGIGSAPAFFGQGETLEQAFELMDAAWETGITWFDTADAYGGGRSETYIGEWVRSRRPDGLRITTKTFNPMAEGEDHGLWSQVHSPLMGGWLTGKYRRDAPAPEGSRMTLRSGPYEHLRNDRVYEALEALEARGDPTTLALAWLLADERVSVVVGPRRPEHLQPALDALAHPLSPDERDALSAEFR